MSAYQRIVRLAVIALSSIRSLIWQWPHSQNKDISTFPGEHHLGKFQVSEILFASIIYSVTLILVALCGGFLFNLLWGWVEMLAG